MMRGMIALEEALVEMPEVEEAPEAQEVVLEVAQEVVTLLVQADQAREDSLTKETSLLSERSCYGRR